MWKFRSRVKSHYCYRCWGWFRQGLTEMTELSINALTRWNQCPENSETTLTVTRWWRRTTTPLSALTLSRASRRCDFFLSAKAAALTVLSARPSEGQTRRAAIKHALGRYRLCYSWNAHLCKLFFFFFFFFFLNCPHWKYWTMKLKYWPS